MFHLTKSLPGGRAAFAAAIFTMLLATAACNKTDQLVTGSAFSDDYRDRHPIRFAENVHSIQLLIGAGTGVLTAEQRAQVASMAGTWRREGTGYLVIETPRGTANQRSAAYAAREATSILRASGVPQRAIVTKAYQTAPDSLGAVRLSYARIEAEVGPCGTWPEDLGASVFPSTQPMPPQFDNRSYWNLGCASQKNLAAMVANPEDLIQPRPMTPAYAARRQTVMEKYRKGENPSGQYDTQDATTGDNE